MRGRFVRALRGESAGVPPVWLMRQAGRYHSAYRELRERHTFEELCTRPELSAEVALGPIRDFDFDAAILFSDLLFPLQALGMSLSYDSGPPQLDGPIDADRVARFRDLDQAVERLRFQAESLAATRSRLPAEKGSWASSAGRGRCSSTPLKGRTTGRWREPSHRPSSIAISPTVSCRSSSASLTCSSRAAPTW